MGRGIQKHFDPGRTAPTPHDALPAVPLRQGQHAAEVIAEMLERALQQHQRGHLREAAVLYHDVLRQDPKCVAAHLNLGAVCQAHGDLDSARLHYQAALRLHPGCPEAYNNLGTVLKAQGDVEAARLHYQIAVRLKPDFVEAHTNLGLVLQALGHDAAAQAAYETALRYRPDDAETLTNLGCILQAQGQLEAALAQHQAALALQPDLAVAHTNLGLVLQLQGQLEVALEQHQVALALRPDLAVAHTNLGLVLQLQGQLEAALARHQAALALQPDLAVAQWNRALIWLTQGNLEQGWPAYEWRWQLSHAPRAFPWPRWDGSALAGRTILVTAEQGLGDELLFASCLPDLLAQAGHCILECAPRLAPLFARAFPTATVYGVARDDRHWLTPALPIDVYSPSGSLPRYLRPTVESFSPRHGYLLPEANRRLQYQQRLDALGPGLKVGIAWRSLKARQHSAHYPPLPQWRALLTLPGVHFVNLQYDDAAAEISTIQQQWGVALHVWDDLDLFNDLEGLAALMAGLDLVIAPDTTAAALAGSLGRPVWRLSTAGGAWDMLGTTRCPWFPSMRVLCQRQPGDWEAVLLQVAQDVARWVHRAHRA